MEARGIGQRQTAAAQGAEQRAGKFQMGEKTGARGFRKCETVMLFNNRQPGKGSRRFFDFLICFIFVERKNVFGGCEIADAAFLAARSTAIFRIQTIDGFPPFGQQKFAAHPAVNIFPR